MKQDDYRKALDEIKCSEEFRSRMEEMLSKPAEEFKGYEAKYPVEAAHKISFSKYIAAAAAFLIVFGAGLGSVFMRNTGMKNMQSDIAESNSSAAYNSDEAAEYDFDDTNNKCEEAAESIQDNAAGDAATAEEAQAVASPIPVGSFSGASCIEVVYSDETRKPVTESTAEELYRVLSVLEWEECEIPSETHRKSMYTYDRRYVFRFTDNSTLIVFGDCSAEFTPADSDAGIWYSPMKTICDEISAVFERADKASSDESPESIITSCLASDIKSGSLRQNAGSQIGGKVVYFDIPAISALREALNSANWQRCDISPEEYLSDRAWFVGNLFILEDGRISDGKNGFENVSGDISAYMGMLDSYIENDDLAHMQYIIQFPEKSYERMSADIAQITYGVKAQGGEWNRVRYQMIGSGRIVYENGGEREYVEVRSHDYDIEERLYSGKYLGDYGDKFIIAKKGSDAETFERSAPSITDENGDLLKVVLANNFYEVPEQEYGRFVQAVCRQIADYDTGEDKSAANVTLEKNGGIWECRYDTEETRNGSNHFTVKVDEYGNVIEYTADENNLIPGNYDLSLYDRIVLENVRYDSEAESVPELTGELLGYFLENAEK